MYKQYVREKQREKNHVLLFNISVYTRTLEIELFENDNPLKVTQVQRYSTIDGAYE